jgi:hypothetical protein
MVATQEGQKFEEQLNVIAQKSQDLKNNAIKINAHVIKVQ